MPFAYHIFEDTRKQQLVLYFGSGDIEIRIGVDPVSCISFTQGFPKPIEEWDKGSDSIADDPGINQSELEGETILFHFSRTESIDILVKSLEEVKKNMITEYEKEILEP